MKPMNFSRNSITRKQVLNLIFPLPVFVLCIALGEGEMGFTSLCTYYVGYLLSFISR